MHESPPFSSSETVLAAPAQRRNAAFYAAGLAASDEEAYPPLAAPHGYTPAPEQLICFEFSMIFDVRCCGTRFSRLASQFASLISTVSPDRLSKA